MKFGNINRDSCVLVNFNLLDGWMCKMKGSVFSGERSLIEEVEGDHRFDVFLADVDQSLQFQPLQQVNRLSQILASEHAQVLSERGSVMAGDLAHQFLCFGLVLERFHQQVGNLGADAELELDVGPADGRGESADCLSGHFDDFGDLYFEPLLGGDVLLGVDAELIAAAAFATLFGSGDLLGLGEAARELLVIWALSEVFEEGVAYALDPGVLVDVVAGVVALGHFEDEGALVDGELLLLAEDHLQLLLDVGAVPEVVLELAADDVVDGGQEGLEVAPGAFALDQLQGAFEAVDEAAAVFAEGDGVGVHVGDEGEYFLGEVGADVLASDALVHVLAEEVLGVVEGLVELDVGVGVVLHVAVEGLAGGRDHHEPLPPQSLLEQVDVLLRQVRNRLADEHPHVQLRVLLHEHVDLQHDFPHLRHSQHLDAHQSLLRLERLHALRLQHHVQRVQELAQLLLLVLPQEQREHQSLLLLLPVLRLASPQQVLRHPLHLLLHQLLLQGATGRQDVLRGVGAAQLVVPASHRELLLFLVHL